MSFASRLKQARENAGFTQQELAKALGVTKSAIGNYENGVSSPKWDVLLKIFDILHVEPNFLYQDSFDLTKKYPVTLTPKQADLIAFFNLLNAAGQNKVIDYAKDLVSTGHYSLGVWWGNQCIPSKEIPAEYFDSLGDTVRETLKNDADSKLSKGAENAKWSVIYSPDISTTHANDESGDINACAVLFDASSTNDHSKPELSPTPPTKAKTK